MACWSTPPLAFLSVALVLMRFGMSVTIEEAEVTSAIMTSSEQDKLLDLSPVESIAVGSDIVPILSELLQSHRVHLNSTG